MTAQRTHWWWFTTATAGLHTQGQDIAWWRARRRRFWGGTFTVAGAGADIWGVADAFAYVSQPIAGDIQIVARVRPQNTASWRRLMLRD
jgi:hypothetical protein